MLRLTADVNGRPIAHIYVHNTGRVSGGKYLYDAAISTGDESMIGVEDVAHRREDGWAKLTLLVLAKALGEGRA